MSGISSLIASHTLEAKAKSKAPAKKAAPSKSAPAASKTMSGLKIKLGALTKKYPGVTFLIKEFKNKKNAVLVKGIAKLTVAQFADLCKEIPNTSHVPQRNNGNTAIFTLFGGKELTGSDDQTPFAMLTAKGDADRGKFLSVLMKACSGDEGKSLVAAFNDGDADKFNTLWAGVSDKVTKALTASDLTLEAAAKPKPKGAARPYYILVDRPKSGGKWAQQFGAYDKKVVTQEMADNKESNRYAEKADKMEYKVLTVQNATQKACNEAVKELNLTASDEPQSRTIAVTPMVQFMTANAPDVKKKDNGATLTASVYLHPTVGAMGVVYRDASSTDDQFVPSTHENQGDRYFATVQEIKEGRLRVDVMKPDSTEPVFKDAWIYATNFYQMAEDVMTAAITNPSLIDNMILQNVADGARKSEDGAVRIADLRKTLPADITSDAVDAALTRMHLDQVLNLQPGSLSDITGSLKVGPDRFTKIYPTDSMMQVFASEDSDLREAKQAHMKARTEYDKKPGPQTKSRLQAAKETLAKLIKRMAKESPVPYAGPPKGKRTGKTMAASEPMFIVKMRNEDGTSYYGREGMSFIRMALAVPLDKAQAQAIVKQYSRSGENRVEMLPFDGTVKPPEMRRGDPVMVSVKEKNGTLTQDDRGDEWYGEVVVIKDGKVRIRFEDDPQEGTPESFVTAPVSKVTLLASDKKVTASNITHDNIAEHRKKLVTLKRMDRENPSTKLKKAISVLKAKITKHDADQIQDHQHETARFEAERRSREG